MANKPMPSIRLAEFPTGRRDCDEDMSQALVTAGAFMALAGAEPEGRMNKTALQTLGLRTMTGHADMASCVYKSTAASRNSG